MIHVGLLNIIRRMALREKLPIREIARRTGMSRNTIKKYLNAGTIEPQFATPELRSQRRRSTDAWCTGRRGCRGGTRPRGFAKRIELV